MGTLRKPEGELKDCAVNITIDFDEANSRPELRIEVLEHGQISAVLWLDLEETGCLKEALTELFARID